jgi:hypothetical protein
MNKVIEPVEQNYNFYLRQLDEIYFQWKKGIYKNDSSWIEKYKLIFEKIMTIKYSLTKKQKIIKMSKKLVELGVAKLSYKVQAIVISLATLEKKASREEKLYFWKRLEEEYPLFQHVFFFVLVVDTQE